MAWEVLKVRNNPVQMSVALVNSDKSATCTTDYHRADALARKTLGAATLNAKGTDLSGRAIRTYVRESVLLMDCKILFGHCSSDTVRYYHGRAKPLTLCGRHAAYLTPAQLKELTQ